MKKNVSLTNRAEGMNRQDGNSKRWVAVAILAIATSALANSEPIDMQGALKERFSSVDATTTGTFFACNVAYPMLQLGHSSDTYSDGRYYAFHIMRGIPAGRTITARITWTNSFQGLITIQNFSSSSTAILASDNGASPLDVTYRVPTTGDYAIGFTSLETFRTGTYELNISCNSDPTPQCPIASIGFDQLQGGALSTSDCKGDGYYYDVFRFNGVKDEPLKVGLSASFAPYLQVAHEDDSLGTWRQLAGPGDLSVTFVPEKTGPILINISGSGTDNKTGSYTLLVTKERLSCRSRPVRPSDAGDEVEE